jgi:hypothetical protein
VDLQAAGDKTGDVALANPFVTTLVQAIENQVGAPGFALKTPPGTFIRTPRVIRAV